MTEEEKILLDCLGRCFVQFDNMPVLHTADRQEFILHVHALQNIVLSRMATRYMREASDMRGERI
jgi:hypothetical protein